MAQLRRSGARLARGTRGIGESRHRRGDRAAHRRADRARAGTGRGCAAGRGSGRLQPRAGRDGGHRVGHADGARRHPDEHAAKGVDFDLYSVGIGASWELDLWGGHRRQAEAAAASVDASDAAARGVRLSVEAEVARTYVQLRGLWDERRIAQAGAAIAEQNAAIARALLARGLATPIDLAAAEETVRSLRGDAVDLDQQAASATRALAVLVGDTPDTAPFDRSVAPPPRPSRPARCAYPPRSREHAPTSSRPRRGCMRRPRRSASPPPISIRRSA
ncbi:TolC family protein [Sphingomonas aurantiaca]|uniref:TolC family protein n=1 Tax=Sphingomonas aurantiaca TaxID=185949 RepID=UPI002FE3362D